VTGAGGMPRGDQSGGTGTDDDDVERRGRPHGRARLAQRGVPLLGAYATVGPPT
jgi:hypothetical protein